MVYDFIVIGSGFGGSVASLRLVEKGYKVLTIEQGKRYRPEDYPKSNWNLPKYLWVPALRFFGLSAPGASTSIHRSANLIKKTITHPCQFLKTFFNFRWSSRLVIFLVMQTIDNSMKMVWKKGLFGGKMKIDNSGNKKVPAYIPVGQEVMERFAKKVNGVAQNILLEIFFNRPTTAHILGGCPMSESSETGVVNENLKVHGYPDFFITDGSVIQGNIGVNPSLTITALSEYALSKIPEKEGNIPADISNQLKQLEKEWKKKRST
jgi:cholesterol oxidase